MLELTYKGQEQNMDEIKHATEEITQVEQIETEPQPIEFV